MGTVTYDVAKRLNALITPFMQKRYMIEATQEFIEIVKIVKKKKTTRIIRRRKLIDKRTNKQHFEHHNRRRVQPP